ATRAAIRPSPPTPRRDPPGRGRGARAGPRRRSPRGPAPSPLGSKSAGACVGRRPAPPSVVALGGGGGEVLRRAAAEDAAGQARREDAEVGGKRVGTRHVALRLAAGADL